MCCGRATLLRLVCLYFYLTVLAYEAGYHRVRRWGFVITALCVRAALLVLWAEIDGIHGAASMALSLYEVCSHDVVLFC